MDFLSQIPTTTYPLVIAAWVIREVLGFAKRSNPTSKRELMLELKELQSKDNAESRLAGSIDGLNALLQKALTILTRMEVKMDNSPVRDSEASGRDGRH